MLDPDIGKSIARLGPGVGEAFAVSAWLSSMRLGSLDELK
jgi:hypothetical protein